MDAEMTPADGPSKAAQPCAAPAVTDSSQPVQPQKKKSKQQQKANEKQQPKKGKAWINENHHRINYLVQVSRYLAEQSHEENQPTSTSPSAPLRQRLLQERKGAHPLALSAMTGATAAAIGRKCVMRLSPSLKRQMCKGCGAALVPAVSATVRHRSRRQKHWVVTCLACGTIKRFVNDPNHQVWAEREEAQV